MTLWLVTIFIIGYISISLETYIRINKAAIALLTGVACWIAYILMSHDKQEVVRQLTESLGDLSGILFFLLSAMTIVEIIDAHKGFTVITNKINQTDKRALVWIISLITFFSFADTRQPDNQYRYGFAAAQAGGKSETASHFYRHDYHSCQRRRRVVTDW